MRNFETILISLNELKANKLRTALTMLGIVFGVASVIAMLSIGEGARQETIEQIELLGSNNIIVKQKVTPTTGSDTKQKVTASAGLNLKDANAISTINPFVKFITPQRESVTKLSYKSEIIDASIIGTTVNFPSTFNSRVSEGVFFQEHHLKNYSNVCVIGAGIKNQLFRFEDPLHKKIKVGKLWFDIIGVIEPKALISSNTNSGGLRNFNDDIYIPITTMMYKMEKYSLGFTNNVGWWDRVNYGTVIDRSTVNQLTIKVTDDIHIAESANLIRRILERRHYGANDFEIIVPEQLLDQKQKTQRIFNIVMGAIAGISLLVGGIGIMNIMLANILERTREIGIRRAVGARGKDILNQFMYEALTISLLGGLLGIIIGFILTSAITSYAEWRTIITPTSVVLAFFVSAIIGLIFGIYPAKKAASKDPIESLRYE